MRMDELQTTPTNESTHTRSIVADTKEANNEGLWLGLASGIMGGWAGALCDSQITTFEFETFSNSKTTSMSEFDAEEDGGRYGLAMFRMDDGATSYCCTSLGSLLIHRDVVVVNVEYDPIVGTIPRVRRTTPGTG